jgi:hypothetical protein
MTKKQQSQAEETKPLVFQEVEIRRLDPVREGSKLITRFERIKVLRTKVNIRQEEADAINEGRAVHPDNKYFVLYLLPGQEVEPLVRELEPQMYRR